MKQHKHLRLASLDGAPIGPMPEGAVVTPRAARHHHMQRHVARTYVICIAAAIVLEGCVYFHKVRLTGEDILTGFLLALTSVKEVAHLVMTHVWEEL